MSYKAESFWTRHRGTLGLMGVLAGLGGAAGYWVGRQLATGKDGSDGLATLIDAAGGIGAAALIMLGWGLVVMYLVSAVLLTLGIFHSGIANNRQLTLGLGATTSGRRSIAPLALFYWASAIKLAALTVWTGGVGASGGDWWTIALAVTVVLSVLIMAATSVVLVRTLDELFRAVWVEATAYTAGAILALASMAAALEQAGLTSPMSSLSFVIAYHALYLPIYIAVAARRSPDLIGLEADCED